MRLIVGLGNPGAEYDDTRHNVGFMALDALATHYEMGPWKKKFKGLLSTSSSKDFLLLKPLTFMNLSGEAVLEAIQFHKIAPKDVIVFHDDLDVPPGSVKIKQGGGSGGHNGIKSIDAQIGQDYWRVRIGIGHPGMKGDVVTNYVLSSFAKADQLWLSPLLNALVGGFDNMLKSDTESYLSFIVKKMNGVLN